MKINFKTGLTPEYRDLVTKLLKYNAEDRLVLLQVFSHPWVMIHQHRLFPNFQIEPTDASESSEYEEDESEEQSEYTYYTETEEVAPENTSHSENIRYIEDDESITPSQDITVRSSSQISETPGQP